MRLKFVPIALGLVAVAATASAAHASEPTTTVVPGTTTPGTVAPGTTAAPPPTVTQCIQGHTVTGTKGGTNPNGYPYYEGPCDTPPSTVQATPHFTG